MKLFICKIGSKTLKVDAANKDQARQIALDILEETKEFKLIATERLTITEGEAD